MRNFTLLEGGERGRPTAPDTDDPGAYRDYLRRWEEWWHGLKEELLVSDTEVQQ